MSDELVIRFCAPTLAAIKTGSLFNLSYADERELTRDLRAMNLCLLAKGVRAIPLRVQHGRALIYLYRPDMLAVDLAHPLARQILARYDYPEGDVQRQIMHLIERLKLCAEFPHEIGLFLGYPAGDVLGFIQHRPCKCTGVWKVYESDEAQARRIFARCRHCTRAYLQRHQEGWSLSRLTIQSGQFS